MLNAIKKLLPSSVKASIQRIAREVVGTEDFIRHAEFSIQEKMDLLQNSLQQDQQVALHLLDQKIERFISGGALSKNNDLSTESIYKEIDYNAFEEKYHRPSLDADYFLIGLSSEDFKAKTAIDLGCGKGELVNFLNNLGCNTSGTDINLSETININIKDNISNLDALAFLKSKSDESVDFIFLIHIAEHLEFGYLLLLLKECHRTLKNNGKLILETPKIASVRTLTNHYFSDPTHLMPRHHNLYIEAGLVAGFSTPSVFDVIEANPEHSIDLQHIEERLSEKNELWLAQIKSNFDLIEQHMFIARDVRLIYNR